MNIIILGADTFQLGLIKYLQSKKYLCHVVSNRPLDYGVLVANSYYNFSYTEKSKLIELYRTIDAIQVLSCASESALKIQTELQSELGLKGLKTEFVEFFQNKLNYKTHVSSVFKGHHPRFVQVNSKADLIDFFKQLNSESVILKPLVGNGSRNVQLIKSFADIEKIRFSEELIAEEEILGDEYGGDFIVYEGKLYFFFLTLKSVNHFFVPFCHLTIADVELNAIFSTFFKELIDVLKLPDGIYNFDAKIKDSKVQILDLSPRIGGNCLPNLALLKYNINEWQISLDILLGNKVLTDKKVSDLFFGVYIIHSEKNGILKKKLDSIYKFENQILEVFWKYDVGATIEVFSQGDKHLGYIIFYEESYTKLSLLSIEIAKSHWFELD